MYLLTSALLGLSLTMTLTFSTTPLTSGLWVLLIALTMASTLGALLSTWFALLLFLIYVGGMLVMFAYFAAISPNQQISVRNSSLMTFLTMGALALISSNTVMSMYPSSPLQKYPFSQLIDIYAPANIPMLIILGLTLLLALIVVVKVASWAKGALRPFN